MPNQTITFILAMDENNLIGKENGLPWKLPADLKYFKKQTLHKTIVMGRKTCESLPFALPHRKNIVLTRNKNFSRKGFENIHDCNEILHGNNEIMVIGGSVIYQLLMPHAKKLLVTKIHHKFEGDTYFSWDSEKWIESKRIDCYKDEINEYDYSFITYIPKSR